MNSSRAIYHFLFTPYYSRMTIDALIMLAGAFIVIEPQLGFPSTWDSVLLFIAGIVVVGLGIAVRRRGLREPIKQTEHAAPRV